MGFAGARWAEEDDVLLGGDEVEAAEVGDAVAFEAAGVVEVEILQRLVGREPGGADPSFAAAVLSGGDFSLQAGSEVLLVGPGSARARSASRVTHSLRVGAFKAPVRNSISQTRSLLYLAVRVVAITPPRPGPPPSGPRRRGAGHSWPGLLQFLERRPRGLDGGRGVDKAQVPASWSQYLREAYRKVARIRWIKLVAPRR